MKIYRIDLWVQNPWRSFLCNETPRQIQKKTSQAKIRTWLVLFSYGRLGHWTLYCALFLIENIHKLFLSGLTLIFIKTSLQIPTKNCLKFYPAMETSTRTKKKCFKANTVGLFSHLNAILHHLENIIMFQKNMFTGTGKKFHVTFSKVNLDQVQNINSNWNE